MRFQSINQSIDQPINQLRQPSLSCSFEHICYSMGLPADECAAGVHDGDLGDPRGLVGGRAVERQHVLHRLQLRACRSQGNRSVNILDKWPLKAVWRQARSVLIYGGVQACCPTDAVSLRSVVPMRRPAMSTMRMGTRLVFLAPHHPKHRPSNTQSSPPAPPPSTHTKKVQ